MHSSPSRALAVEENLQEAVERVLASPAFRRSHRLSQLLQYLAEHTVGGDVEGLKEQAIGQRVFGRPATYSSAEDNIVRSNIRQLRLKLEEYYAGPGAGDAAHVVLPKGSYSLLVERPAAAILEVPAAADEAKRNWRRSAVGGAACGLAVVAIAGALMPWMPTRAAVEPAVPRCLLGLIAPNPGQRLLVVVPDADVQLYQRLTGQAVSLQKYLERHFTEPKALQAAGPELSSRTEALFHNITTQSFVLDLIPKFAQVVPPAQLSVRHPATLTVSDFEHDNAVLISGPNGDPWVQLFDGGLNFQIENEGQGPAHIRNRAPQEGEQDKYSNYKDSKGTDICYARIAYLPGLASGGRALLAGGPHTASTQAACRWLTDRDSLETVERLFGVKTGGRLPWFELLVESRALGNSPWSMRVLAHRVVRR